MDKRNYDVWMIFNTSVFVILYCLIVQRFRLVRTRSQLTSSQPTHCMVIFFIFTTCRLMKSSAISPSFYKLYVYIFTFILRISILTLNWLRLSEISFGPWIWSTNNIAMFGIEASLYINFSKILQRYTTKSLGVSEE